VNHIFITTIFVSSCYHRGRRNTYHHTNLLQLEGVNDKAASNFYLGKKVAYIYKAQKAVSGSKFRVVWGKVMRGHGTNGVVRAKFSTNLSVSLS
jgi:large subunit ribosomal protein L35Ae